MKTTNFIIIAALFITIWTTACQTGAATKNTTVYQPEIKTANNTVQPEAKTAANNNQPKVAKSEPDEALVGSLATPTDAYKTAFAARQKKDVQALKKVLSKKMLDFFTDIGKAEGKNLDDHLKQLASAPQAANAEARNEKINGDKATLEYLDERGNWKTMDFVKENNGWKLTMPDRKSPFGEDTEK